MKQNFNSLDVPNRTVNIWSTLNDMNPLDPILELSSTKSPVYNPIMTEVIQINPEILGGTPVFAGTRVPVETLFDYLEGGEPMAEFLADFPTVTEAQVKQLLSELKDETLRKKFAA